MRGKFIYKVAKKISVGTLGWGGGGTLFSCRQNVHVHLEIWSCMFGLVQLIAANLPPEIYRQTAYKCLYSEVWNKRIEQYVLCTVVCGPTLLISISTEASLLQSAVQVVEMLNFLRCMFSCSYFVLVFTIRMFLC